MRCLKSNRYVPAELIHHILPVAYGGSNDESKHIVYGSTDNKTWKKVATVVSNYATILKLTACKKYYFRVCALDSSKKIASSYTSF